MLTDAERARLYHVARLTPARADRWFASVSMAEAQRLAAGRAQDTADAV